MKHLAQSTALLLLLSTPALALTPQEAWDIWAEPLANAPGNNLDTVTPVMEGDSLVVTNLVWAIPTRAGSQQEAFVTVPEMRFTPQGDTVVLTLPEIRYASTAGDNFLLDLSNGAMEMQDAARTGVLGAVAMRWEGDVSMDVTYDVGRSDTPTHSLSLSNFVLDMPAGEADGSARITSAFDALTGSITIPDPNTQTTGTLLVETSDSATTIVISDIEALMAGDPIQAINTSVDIAIESSQGAGSYTVAFPNNPMQDAASWENAQTTINLNRAGLTYGFAMENTESVSSSPMDPRVSLRVNTQSLSGTVAMPLFADEYAQQASIALNVDTVMINTVNGVTPEELAPFVDTPISIDMMMEADLVLDTDLFPADIASMRNQQPPQMRIDAVRIPTFASSFGDTTLSAQGAMTTMGMVPNVMPSNGTMDITLTNVADFLDKLVAGGLIPEQDRTMSEMMLRGFAKPGETTTLTYTLDFDGTTYRVNGNPF